MLLGTFSSTETSTVHQTLRHMSRIAYLPNAFLALKGLCGWAGLTVLKIRYSKALQLLTDRGKAVAVVENVCCELLVCGIVPALLHHLYVVCELCLAEGAACGVGGVSHVARETSRI